MKYIWRLSAVLLAVLFASPLWAQPERPGDIPLESFAQMPMVQNVRISPDGTHFSYLRPIEGKQALVIQNFADNTFLVIPGKDEFQFEWAEWANNDRMVFSLSFAARRFFVDTEETRLFAVDRDGGNLIPLIKSKKIARTGGRLTTTELAPPQLQDRIASWLPDEPNHILVVVDDDHDGNYEIRKVDITDANYKEVSRSRRGIQSWALDANQQVRMGWGYDRINGFSISIKDAGGAWRDSNDLPWSKLGYEPVALAVDPQFLYVAGPGDNGLDSMKKVDLATNEIVEAVFSHPDVDVGGIVIDPVTHLPVGVSYTHHEYRVEYFDADFQKLQKSVDSILKGTVNTIVSMTSDRQKIVINASSDTDPGVVYLWDRPAKRISEIAVVMPDLPVQLLSPMQPVRYIARDGQTIPAYLTLPLGAEARGLPTVVMPHGGPHSRTSRDYWFLRHFLASRGYAVLEPNFRGSTGYGDAFELAGRKQWGGVMQDDVTDAAQWLIDQGIADPKRLCIVGWSYGGYAAAMAAVKTPELFQCAASINGVMNLPGLLGQIEKFIGGNVWSRSIGLDGERSKAVSPLHRAKEITIPMLLIQAKDDRTVLESQSSAMAERLEELGKPVRFVTVDYGGHGMANETARTMILGEVEKFLAVSLSGAGAAAAADAGH